MLDPDRAKQELVTVPCPLCGCEKHRRERELRGFTLVRCTTCTFVFMNPRMTGADVADIYADRHNPEELIALYSRIATPKVMATYDKKLDLIEGALGRRGRLLDFACAAGYFLERAVRRGWEAHGVDLGEWAKLAGERRGLSNIHIGPIEDLGLPDGYFDVVYAAQVFEHLEEPLATLRELRRILNPAGIMYMDVPNYRTLPIMLGRDDFYLNTPPQHVNFFTARTLALLLTKGRFRIEILESGGGLKWENLIGRPIISDIADAYRAPGASAVEPTFAASAPRPGRMRMARDLLYRRLKLGMNLSAICRRAD